MGDLSDGGPCIVVGDFVQTHYGKHCFHYAGQHVPQHGQYVPIADPSAGGSRNMYRCCNCGQYMDAWGVKWPMETIKWAT